MLELIVLSRREAGMQRFLCQVQRCRGRKPVRVLSISHPGQASGRVQSGVVRWLIADENRLARPCTIAVAGRLARAGTLRIGVRRRACSTQRDLALPAGLRALAEGGAALLAFQFDDQHVDLMTQALGLRRRAPRQLAGHHSPADTGAGKDPLHVRAAALATPGEPVSLSLIQRSLGISYSHAQRLAEAVAGA